MGLAYCSRAMTTSTADTLTAIATALESEGYTTRQWRDRLYIKLRGRELGYITAEDDGRSGSCRYVQRSGDISRIIRETLAA